MTQSLNQAGITAEVGAVSSGAGQTNLIQCQIDLASVNTDIIGGTPLKLVDTAGRVPVVDRAGVTDTIFGFMVISTENNNPQAGKFIDVAIEGAIMRKIAGAAVARGAVVETAANDKVITSAGINHRVGISLDKAVVDGDFIRILIKTPSITQV